MNIEEKVIAVLWTLMGGRDSSLSSSGMCQRPGIGGRVFNPKTPVGWLKLIFDFINHDHPPMDQRLRVPHDASPLNTGKSSAKTRRKKYAT